MANYATLKAAIADVIKTNGSNEITGALLQQSLLSMIDALGANYQFAGIATPETDPGTPDQNVFYIASTNGIYSNFNSISLNSEIAILKWSSNWSKNTIYKLATGNSFQWRQGYTQGGENMEFLAESEKEISTYGIPVGLFNKIFVLTGYILNVFQYDANGGYIGYYPITGTSTFVDFTISTEKVDFLRFSLRKANGDPVNLSEGVTAVSVKREFAQSTGNSFQWRQGYTQGGQNMEFFADSTTEISTYGIPIALFNKVSVASGYIMNIFQYNANGDYIGYQRVDGSSSFIDFVPLTDKVVFVRFSLRKANGDPVNLSEGVTAVSVKVLELTQSTGNSFQWRQGYTQGGQNMEFFVDSTTEISTYGIPVGLVKKIYVATDYILNVFQYDANGGYIGYQRVDGNSSYNDFSQLTETVEFIRFSLRKANGGNVAVADGISLVKIKGLEIEEQNVPDDNNFIGSYAGDKIVLDANEKRYLRYKFLSVQENSKLNQSMAIFGNYVVLMMDGHSSPFGYLYNINTGEKICDLNFQYDLTDYSACHSNACSFGVEYYNSQSEFPLFYVSQYVGERAYFVYDFQKQNDNTYIPVLVQIIKPDSTLKNDASFGAGYGDFSIDTEHSIMFHLGYYSEEDWQTPRLTKFTLPGKNDGVTTVLTSGLSVKVVTLTTSDILASALPNINGFQDTTYKNGYLYINGYGGMFLMDVTDYSIKNTIYTTSPLYNEIEGVSFFGNRLMATYWEIEGVHEIYFL